MLALLLWFSLGLLLTITIVGDLRARTIPNWLTGLVAALGVVSWFVGGLLIWPDIALRLVQGIACLALFAILFARGAMGGGDVKLIAGLALWLPFQMLMGFFVVMSVLGGVVSLFYLVKNRLVPNEGDIEVPYGVAIALGGFWAIANQFGPFLRII